MRKLILSLLCLSLVPAFADSFQVCWMGVSRRIK